MVTARTQRLQTRAAKKEAAAAEAKIEQEVAKAKVRAARKEGGWPCTAEQIVEQRDKHGLSWRHVAANLGLGSPGQARKAYAELTGRSHTESVMTGRRATRGTGSKQRTSPGWHDDSDQDEIIERLTHATIVVRRDAKGIPLEEDAHVCRIDKFAFDGPDGDGPLVVHVITKDLGECECNVKPQDAGTGTWRCFRVADIVEVSG